MAKQDSSKRRRATVVIAGAGAGKTTAMVGRILEKLPHLQPSRVLAAITYTNSASDIIRTSLEKHGVFMNNIFVGTIHAFFHRFIVQPYAAVLKVLPEDICIGPFDVESAMRQSRTGKKLDKQAVSKARSRITSAMLAKGHVPFDGVLTVARDLVKFPDVRRHLGQRIQYLFIDELQDMNKCQYDVFDHVRKEKRTEIFAVGDPEQYISGFAIRGMPKPAFSNLYFFRFLKSSERIDEADNHRSCGELVQFTNRFRTEVQQAPRRGMAGTPSVYFINKTALRDIVRIFQSLARERAGIDHQTWRHLYLSFENKQYSQVMGEFGMVHLNAELLLPGSIMSKAEKLIEEISGMSRRAFCQKYMMDHFKYRLLSFELLKSIRSSAINRADDITTFLSKAVNGALAGPAKLAEIDKCLVEIQNTVGERFLAVQQRHQCSSIHRAKGHEAEAVLVLAKNLSELNAWLTTDIAARKAAKVDTHRIGYVAFTRPRELLSIACLQPLDDPTLDLLGELGVSLTEERDEGKPCSGPHVRAQLELLRWP